MRVRKRIREIDGSCVSCSRHFIHEMWFSLSSSSMSCVLSRIYIYEFTIAFWPIIVFSPPARAFYINIYVCCVCAVACPITTLTKRPMSIQFFPPFLHGIAAILIFSSSSGGSVYGNGIRKAFDIINIFKLYIYKKDRHISEFL